MSSLTITLTFALAMISSVLADPSCVRLGHKVCGTDLTGPCVHATDDYSVAYDVVDGVVEAVLTNETPVSLEVYSGTRVLTEYEDCCPPPSFMHELHCTEVHEQGSCCVSETHVHVTGLPEHVGCVHSVEDYASYNPTSGSVSWPTDHPELNHEVEMYGGQHNNGCCACYLHAVQCSPCE